MTSRRQQEETLRREYILSGAERLFARRGIAATAMSDIARETEFGVGTLYRYFKDKNTLIGALLESRLGSHFAMLEAALRGVGTTPQRMERLVDAYFASICDRFDFFRMYYADFHPVQGHDTGIYPGAHGLEECQRSLIERMDEVFLDGMNNGEVIDVGSPRYLSAAIFGMMMAFYFLLEMDVVQSTDTDEAVPLDDIASRTVEMRSVLLRILFEKVRLTL